jgi:multidrug efflux pump subunit AcrB
VGQDKERSMVKLYDKIMSHMDFAPPGASQPLVKPIDVDDVPVVAITLSPAGGSDYDDAQLRLVADHVLDELRKVPGVGTTTVIGGRSRQVTVTLDPLRIAGYGLSPLQIAGAINQSNANLLSGELEQGNRKLTLETGGFFTRASDIRHAVVGVANNKPVYLGDVAEVTDGFEETAKLTRIAILNNHDERTVTDAGARRAVSLQQEHPAVTLALAKRQKLNAVQISNQILTKLE